LLSLSAASLDFLLDAILVTARSANLTWCPSLCSTSPRVAVTRRSPLANKAVIAAADLDPAEILLLAKAIVSATKCSRPSHA